MAASRHRTTRPILLLALLCLTGQVSAQPQAPAPASEPKPPTEIGSEPATEPSSETEPEPETEAETETEAEPATETATETEAEAGAEPEAGAAAGAEAAAPQPAAAPTGPGAPATVCQGKKIVRLEVQGQGRVSADDIRATIRLRKGLPCTDGEVTRDVRALWDMGYFRDIQVEARPAKGGIALIYRVKERRAVSEVVYIGNDEVERSDLEEKVTLEEGSILSEPSVREQLDKIRELYAEKGFFLAKVEYELEEQPNDAVAVKFLIDEGDEVTVRRIRFVGNENLTDDELASVMQTSETGLFSFLSDGDTYRKELFDEDLTRLQALYYDFGYLMVEVANPRIELTADRRYIDITIQIKEGPRFKVGRVKVAEVDERGKDVEPLAGRRNLRESIELNPGDWFSRSVIAQNLMDITRYYRDRGYARVDVSPQTNLNEQTRIVDIVVQIRRGPLVYIQRINIKGNSKTRDEVLRREARIVEGQLYSQTLVERSKDRIMSLGYFETVEVSEEDGATPDRIVINYEVAERPTGTFQLGAGFSSQETFLLTGQIQQENLFGRGQSLSFNLQLSGIRQLAQVRFVEPYLYGSDWTMAAELFKVLRRLRDFNRDSTGGNLTLGHPLWFISDDLRLFLNYRLEYTDITPATGGAFGATGEDFDRFRFIPLRNLFRAGTTSSLRLSLTYDSRNNRLFPTEGILATGSTEVSDEATLSDNNFVRHRVNFRGYQPIIGPFVGKLNVEWGLVTSRDGEGVPVFERYFLGGITDLRGFPIQTVGPRLGTSGTYNDPNFQLVLDRGVGFGGNMQLYYNLEVEFPIIESVGIKGVVFQDAGNAWNLEDPLCEPAPRVNDDAIDPCGVDLTQLRTSWGFGVRWFSPLGPLRFEWGFPFRPRKPFEQDMEFQFTVGNAF